MEEDVQEIIQFWDDNGFGFSNINAKQRLLLWLDTERFPQPKPVILKAMGIACANNKRKLNYIVGILKNWQKESLLTVADIDSEQEDRKSVPQSTSPVPAGGRVIPDAFKLDLTAGEH